MWSIKQLKTEAKAVLSHCYWKAFAVTLLLTAIMGNMDKIQFFLSGTDMDTFGQEFKSFIQYDLADINIHSYLLTIPVFARAIFMFALAAIAVLALRSFIGAPFEIGAAKYFTEATSGQENLNNIAFGFNCGEYKNIVWTMVLRYLYTFLWGLLLIVPGIIKYYSYSMVPYIIADNPGLSSKKAFKISQLMTKNNKWKMFLFDLSFVGWYILGVFVFGIGTIFVDPYYRAAKAELYTTLRRQILSSPHNRPVYYGEETKNIEEKVKEEALNG